MQIEPETQFENVAIVGSGAAAGSRRFLFRFVAAAYASRFNFLFFGFSIDA